MSGLRFKRRFPWEILLPAVVLTSLGVLTGFLLAPTAPPHELENATPAAEFSPTSQKFSDARDVQLSVVTEGQRVLASPATGTVTRWACRPGTVFSSGSSSISIDDSPILSLATVVPLWRDLGLGATGRDVQSLQRALNVLGADLAVDGRLNLATRSALSALVKSIGGTWTGTLLRRGVIWLPTRTVNVTSCETLLGAELGAGSTIAKSAGRIVRMKPKVPPVSLFEGRRVVVVGDVAVTADANSEVSDGGAIAKIKKTAAYRSWLDSKGAVPLIGSLQLAKPIVVLSVPPSAVFGLESGGPCIIAEGKALRIRIVTSSLGRTVIQVPTQKIPSQVQAQVPQDMSCG